MDQDQPDVATITREDHAAILRWLGALRGGYTKAIAEHLKAVTPEFLLALNGDQPEALAFLGVVQTLRDERVQLDEVLTRLADG